MSSSSTKRGCRTRIDGAPAAAPRLHPNLSEIYRKNVANLHAALADRTTQTEALEILRSLTERVSVHHGDDGFTIELTGEIANMVKLSCGTESVTREPYRRSVKVVAGTRNHLDLLLRATTLGA